MPSEKRKFEILRVRKYGHALWVIKYAFEANSIRKIVRGSSS